jgi:hypothetical protein
MAKKKVPVVITTNQENATYILKASEIEVHKEDKVREVAKRGGEESYGDGR